MKVLLTGASGFLGRHVLHSLRQHGIETVLLGRQPPVDPKATAWIAADLLASSRLGHPHAQAQATHSSRIWPPSGYHLASLISR